MRVVERPRASADRGNGASRRESASAVSAIRVPGTANRPARWSGVARGRTRHRPRRHSITLGRSAPGRSRGRRFLPVALNCTSPTTSTTCVSARRRARVPTRWAQWPSRYNRTRDRTTPTPRSTVATRVSNGWGMLGPPKAGMLVNVEVATATDGRPDTRKKKPRLHLQPPMNSCKLELDTVRHPESAVCLARRSLVCNSTTRR
jgi:hypothetical protein